MDLKFKVKKKWFFQWEASKSHKSEPENKNKNNLKYNLLIYLLNKIECNNFFYYILFYYYTIQFYLIIVHSHYILFNFIQFNKNKIKKWKLKSHKHTLFLLIVSLCILLVK
jgi:hypothetical protein